MSTNETQSKEWTGDGWRVIARPGQVMLMFIRDYGPPSFSAFADGSMWVDVAPARFCLAVHRQFSEGHCDALEAAIVYAWPKSVGTFTERGVTV